MDQISGPRRQLMMRLVFAIGLLMFGGAASPSPAQGVDPASSEAVTADGGVPEVRQQDYRIPITLSRERTEQLHARLCWVPGGEPARLVIINHGSPEIPEDRKKMQLGRCTQEAANWFLKKGYAVAFVLRRGYGETGGTAADTEVNCEHADFLREGVESAIDIDATVNYFTSNISFVRPSEAVVVGQSSGGWATIAYDSLPHPRVSAFVNMSGGRGGHRHNQPNDNCRPDLLIRASGYYGKTASTPMLWIYANNDSFFGPQLARDMWRAFTQSGGRADFVELPAFATDGHRLFFGRRGSAQWGPLVEQYLK